MDVIQYSDLFSPDIASGIEGLIKSIKQVQTSMDEMIEDVQAKAKGLGEALAGTSSSTKGGRDNTQAQAAQAEALYASYQQLKEGTKLLSEQMASLTKVEESNKRIVDALKTSNNEFASVLDRVKAEAELASAALGKIATGGNDAEIKRLTTTVKTLEGQIKTLEAAMKSTASTQSTVKTSTNAVIQETSNLGAAYASLSDLCAKTNINLNYLLGTHKQVEQATKNGIIANNSLKGSYDQLAAQYNLCKLALNSMSDSMRNSEKVGKVWEAEALRIMNTMKAMQEATGKSTLSVGDYGKALNGLSISTQQVLREMPTLANSVQQFFIAISNNVPIFVDNFKRAAEELGGFTKAVKATMSAIFSWQTVLLVILTILPKIAKAIHDKKKAQEEANKETEKAITYEEMMANAYRASEQEQVKVLSKLKFLTTAMQDNNRSWEERIKAAEIMKKTWKDEFANFTTEEILAGKATGKIDEMTKALIKQAKARAYLNEIEKLAMQEYDAKKALESLNETLSEQEESLAAASAVVAANRQKTIEMYGEGQAKFMEYSKQTHTQRLEDERTEQDLQTAVSGTKSEIEKQNKTLEDTQKAMKDIEKEINVVGLDFEETTSRVRTAAEKMLSIPSYYFELLQSIVNLTEDALDKELAQFDLDHEELMAKRTEQLGELMTMETDLQDKIAKEKNAKKKAEYEEELRIVRSEMERINKIVQNEQLAYEVAREQMVAAHVEKRLDIQRKGIQTEQQAAKNARDKDAYEHYETEMAKLDASKDNTAAEIKLKEELNKALLASEEQYWKDYLKQLRDEGVLTVEAYNDIMEKIAGFNDAKATSNTTSNRKKRGSKNFRNVTEVAFAYSSWGEDILDEKGNKIGRKIKDEYLDFASAVNDAIQTSIDYMDEWMDKRIEMAELAVEKAQEESEAAKTALDYEMQARANGYANNVELARKEYEEKKRLEQEAIAEQKRLQKIQDGINTAQQIGALVTATANLWSAYASIPFAGPALAIAATALMWGSFLAAKIQAASLANETHGEGMAEYLDYGGSHASGHDIDFGHTKDGRKRRVEKGEVVGVIRRDKVQKYGVDKVLDIIKSLNNGTYDDHSRVITSEELINNVFGETPENRANSLFLQSKIEDMLRGAESGSMGLKMPFMDKSDGLSANYSVAFDGLRQISDLSVLERGVGELIKQGEVRVVQTAEGRIEYRGNNKRIIRNG